MVREAGRSEEEARFLRAQLAGLEEQKQMYYLKVICEIEKSSLGALTGCLLSIPMTGCQTSHGRGHHKRPNPLPVCGFLYRCVA
jgi:hypothetical protein